LRIELGLRLSLTRMRRFISGPKRNYQEDDKENFRITDFVIRNLPQIEPKKT
jgi:hypothetical protein